MSKLGQIRVRPSGYCLESDVPLRSLVRSYRKLVKSETEELSKKC